MVSQDVVEGQLKHIGCNYRFWGRSELDELKHILMDAEIIKHCVNGQYENGFALLCATDHRVLLVDKKPMNYLNVQDIRFEMISQFDYSHRMFNAGVHICTPTRNLEFTSWNQHRLRALLSYVQQRVIEIRNYYSMAQQFQTMAARQLQQPQQQTTPTYVPNMAFQPAADGTAPAGPSLSDVANSLGVFTSSKLPHLRRHHHQRLGSYAIPDEIYPPVAS